MEKAMLAHGAPAWAIAAMLRELVGQCALPSMAGIEAAGAVELGKGARQGASGTSIPWNYLVSAFTSPLTEDWESEVTLEWCQAAQPWSIFWYADNAIVIADAPEHRQT